MAGSTVSLRLDDGLRERLGTAAAAGGTTVTALVERFVREGLAVARPLRTGIGTTILPQAAVREDGAGAAALPRVASSLLADSTGKRRGSERAVVEQTGSSA